MTGIAQLRAGLVSSTGPANVSVQVADTNIGIGGGFIYNPYSEKDQRLPLAETLYISLLGKFTFNGHEGGPYEITGIAPGASFLIPPNIPVWAASASANHAFSSIFLGSFIESPLTPWAPWPASFPPTGPTGLLQTIKSYLYQEYSDDDDLQAFVAAYNSQMQSIVDAFNQINLPVYTGTLIAGALLDWVGLGLYGYPRPYIFSQKARLLGPLNTYPFNYGVLPLNRYIQLLPSGSALSSDDLYKRCLTWHLYKGDGKYFNIRWLKRRVIRFIFGINGTDGPLGTGGPGLDNTDQISVTFGPDYSVTIRFVLYDTTIVGGTLPNRFCPGRLVNPSLGFISGTPAIPNSIKPIIINLPTLPYMNEFQAAVQQGVLELPFQFTFDVVIG